MLPKAKTVNVGDPAGSPVAFSSGLRQMRENAKRTKDAVNPLDQS